MTEAQAIKRLARLVETYPSQRKAAQHIGCSHVYLNDVLHGRRHMGQKLAYVVGLSRTIASERTYRYD